MFKCETGFLLIESRETTNQVLQSETGIFPLKAQTYSVQLLQLTDFQVINIWRSQLTTLLFKQKNNSSNKTNKTKHEDNLDEQQSDEI